MLRSGVKSQSKIEGRDPEGGVTTNFRRPWLSVAFRRWQESHLVLGKAWLWVCLEESERANLESL
jgi:hypothetical protein